MIDRLEYRLRSLGDFINVRGDIVQLYGCSFRDTTEFINRIDKIRLAVQSAPTGVDGVALGFDSLMSDKVFSQHVERCLELHGLNLSDVSLRHIQDLLLYEVQLDSEGNPELVPGLLIRINTPRTSQESSDETTRQLGGDPEKDNYEKALATIATHTKSVNEAVELTRIMSAVQLTDYMKQSSDIQEQINKASSAVSGTPTGGDKAEMMANLNKYCD